VIFTLQSAHAQRPPLQRLRSYRQYVNWNFSYFTGSCSLSSQTNSPKTKAAVAMWLRSKFLLRRVRKLQKLCAPVRCRAAWYSAVID